MKQKEKKRKRRRRDIHIILSIVIHHKSHKTFSDKKKIEVLSMLCNIKILTSCCLSHDHWTVFLKGTIEETGKDKSDSR